MRVFSAVICLIVIAGLSSIAHSEDGLSAKEIDKYINEYVNAPPGSDYTEALANSLWKADRTLVRKALISAAKVPEDRESTIFLAAKLCIPGLFDKYKNEITKGMHRVLVWPMTKWFIPMCRI